MRDLGRKLERCAKNAEEETEAYSGDTEMWKGEGVESFFGIFRVLVLLGVGRVGVFLLGGRGYGRIM